jgi:hypothetical protein
MACFGAFQLVLHSSQRLASREYCFPVLQRIVRSGHEIFRQSEVKRTPAPDIVRICSRNLGKEMVRYEYNREYSR